MGLTSESNLFNSDGLQGQVKIVLIFRHVGPVLHQKTIRWDAWSRKSISGTTVKCGGYTM
jgi:hypothetical protein